MLRFYFKGPPPDCFGKCYLGKKGKTRVISFSSSCLPQTGPPASHCQRTCALRSIPWASRGSFLGTCPHIAMCSGDVRGMSWKATHICPPPYTGRAEDTQACFPGTLGPQSITARHTLVSSIPGHSRVSSKLRPRSYSAATVSYPRGHCTPVAAPPSPRTVLAKHGAGRRP